MFVRGDRLYNLHRVVVASKRVLEITFMWRHGDVQASSAMFGGFHVHRYTMVQAAKDIHGEQKCRFVGFHRFVYEHLPFCENPLDAVDPILFLHFRTVSYVYTKNFEKRAGLIRQRGPTVF